MKAFVYPEQALVVWAAEQAEAAGALAVGPLGRIPLRQPGPRPLHHAPSWRSTPKGKFLGIRVSLIANIGAYLSPIGPFIPTRSTDLISGLYTTPAIAINVKGVCTNTVPVCAYRGAGRPEAVLPDRAAGRCGGARAEHDAGQDPPHQPDPRKGHPLHVADQAHLRLAASSRRSWTPRWKGRLEGLQGAAEGEREARQAARHRHGDLYRALRRRLARDRVDRVQGRPRRSRDGQPGIRHRPGHVVQAARLGPARHRCRPDRRGLRRHRPFAARPHRRLARAPRRRLGAARGLAQDHRQGQADRREPAGSVRGRHRIRRRRSSASSAPTGRSTCSTSPRPRRIRRNCRPAWSPGSTPRRCRTPPARRFRTAATSPRSRSIRTAA